MQIQCIRCSSLIISWGIQVFIWTDMLGLLKDPLQKKVLVSPNIVRSQFSDKGKMCLSEYITTITTDMQGQYKYPYHIKYLCQYSKYFALYLSTISHCINRLLPHNNDYWLLWIPHKQPEYDCICAVHMWNKLIYCKQCFALA